MSVPTTCAVSAIGALFHAPDVIAHPYPLYHTLRSEAPVYWREQSGAWMLTRYADVVQSLRDPRLSAVTWPKGLRPVPFLTNCDPPDHTRLRKCAHAASLGQVIEHVQCQVQTIVDELIDAVEETHRMDVIADFAEPLPTIVTALLLGLPVEDHKQLRAWIDAVAALLGSVNGLDQLTRARQAYQAIREMVTYFRRRFADRSDHSQEGMVGALLSMLDDRSTLDEDEAIGICMSMLFGGQETTTNLIGNGLLTLLQHPEQFQRLHHDSSLLPSAIEELLRYESPVQSLVRVAIEDIEIDGTTIRKRERVILCLGAANRDPAQFSDPDRLDITRADNRHVALGYGVHYCVGAQLARLEARAVFATILRRLPKIRLAGDVPIWKASIGYRGLKALPVLF